MRIRYPAFLPVVLGAFACATLAADSGRAAEPTGPSAEARGREIRGNSKKPKAWHYGRVGALEILSTADDSTTEGLLENYVLANRALDLFWPVTRAEQSRANLVVTGRQEDFHLVNPTAGDRSAGAMLGGRGTGVIRAIVNLGLQTAPPPVVVQTKRSADTNRTTSAVIGIAPAAPRGPVGREQIIANLTQALLKRERGETPPWLNAGFGKFLTEMTASRTAIAFPELSADKTFAVRKAGAEADLQKALAAGSIFPLERLFAGTNLSGSETAVDECYEFIHLCLFGAGGKYRKAFVGFVDELHAGKTVDEPAFKERFGLDYHGMLLELWRDTDLAKKTSYKLATPDGKALPAVEKIAFREATDAEIGRLVDPASAEAPGF